MRIICAPMYRLMAEQSESQCYDKIFIILARLLYQRMNNVDMSLCYMS